MQIEHMLKKKGNYIVCQTVELIFKIDYSLKKLPYSNNNRYENA